MKRSTHANETGDKAPAAGLTPIGRDLIGGVPIALEARLGKATMSVKDLFALTDGSVVQLEAGLADHAELYFNDALVARGEIVAVGDNYAIRIVDVAPEA